MPAVNIASREFKADPYPFYARLRAEAPVYRTVLPDKQPAWLVTRYDDVLMVLKDDQRFVKDPRNAKSAAQIKKLPWIPAMFRPLERNLLGVDWTDHMRLRGLVHQAFKPRMVDQMEKRVQALVRDLMDAAERRGRMDLISEYALPVPLTIISEILGIPAKDQGKFHRWSKGLISVSATGSILLAIPYGLAMIRYLRRTFKVRRAPSSTLQADLISALVQAGEAGDRLSEDELLAMVFILIVAGHETTVNLIGSGMLALLENPDQLALLRQDPALIKNAIEELLRYVSPVETATERYAREDVTLHGVTIPKGDMVLAVIASANRDEQHFPDPDRLDITRESTKPLAFGQGLHYCIGAPLARLEGRIAIGALIERWPSLRLEVAPRALRWRPGLTVRGLESLPVAR